ncbi:hypothetical protein GHT06_014657 [Daphnia sinensis]|uniref:Uncharacterized protein n=1 Tax=Daphnia sinensis TaxID=1820382 RepID=A0AAD5L844_9CRUS|nr:hypothetical protein GHT06_014657 [Daphnia sinensis]
MPRFSAFPPPPPLPGTKKAFPEVRGRALPPGVRKFIAKPATPAVPVKPSATEARTPSPLAVKTPLYASATLKKPDEASFFRSKIPVRIRASTTVRLDHQDHDIPKGDDGQDLAAKRARPAPRAKFISRIPVRKVTIGRADSVIDSCSGDIHPGETQSLVLDSVAQDHENVGEIEQSASLIQSGENELVPSPDSQLNSDTVSLPTRRQKRNAALKARRKAKKTAACVMAS